MVVVEAQLLLAVCAVFGMVHIQYNRLRWCGVAGDELIDEGLSYPIDILGRGRIFQPGKRGPTGQIVIRIQGALVEPQLEHRVRAQRIGVIGILIRASDLEDALGQQVPQVMPDIRRVAVVIEGRSQALGQANLAVDPAQNHRTKVRGKRPSTEIPTDRQAIDGRKSELFWRKIGHGRPRFSFYEAFLAKHQLYQLVERGSPFFMNYPG